MPSLRPSHRRRRRRRCRHPREIARAPPVPPDAAALPRPTHPRQRVHSRGCAASAARRLELGPTGLQDHVTRAQQALDYLDRLAETARGPQGRPGRASLPAPATVPSRCSSMPRCASWPDACRTHEAGRSRRRRAAGLRQQPATQRFRIRGLDIATLRPPRAANTAFSTVASAGRRSPSTLEPASRTRKSHQRLDRALAAIERAREPGRKGRLVFSRPESDWLSFKDSIAAERPRPRDHRAKCRRTWPPSSGTGRDRRQCRRPAPEPARSGAGPGACTPLAGRRQQLPWPPPAPQVTEVQTPPPEVRRLPPHDFSSAAASTDYESLVALTSALVGVSRDRVLALLGLR